jgi:hypothetical protein
MTLTSPAKEEEELELVFMCPLICAGPRLRTNRPPLRLDTGPVTSLTTVAAAVPHMRQGPAAGHQLRVIPTTLRLTPQTTTRA